MADEPETLVEGEMTKQQYERWRDFAMRMARTCFRQHRRPNAKWIEAVVADFFDGIDDADIPCIVDWDNSTAYPRGNPCYGREGHLSWCGCDGYRLKNKEPNPECDECHGGGIHHALVRCRCIGDSMSEFLYDYQPRPATCPACCGSERGGECRCEEIEQLFWEQWEQQWGGPVRYCIRAGLDCASAPSAGVVGFTAGDVRRMYPEGVPDWVFPPNERLHIWLSDEINGTFSELPDSAGVVL